MSHLLDPLIDTFPHHRQPEFHHVREFPIIHVPVVYVSHSETLVDDLTADGSGLPARHELFLLVHISEHFSLSRLRFRWEASETETHRLTSRWTWSVPIYRRRSFGERPTSSARLLSFALEPKISKERTSGRGAYTPRLTSNLRSSIYGVS